MANTAKKEKDLIEYAASLGYRVAKRTGHGHLKFIHPEVPTPIFAAPHSDDWRAMKNAKSQLANNLRSIGDKNGRSSQYAR